MGEITVDKVGPQNRFLPKQKGKIIEQSIVMYLAGTRLAFHGWENLTIGKSLDTLATHFKFRIPQKFRDANKQFKLSPNVKVQINVNEYPVIKGRVESIVSVFNIEENYLEVSGRSLTADLVDCSIIGPTEYNNIPLDKLARELIKPFGLKVFLSAIPKVISKVSIKPGDTVFEVLDKYARAQGLFWVTTREGNLRLASEANSRADTKIEEGVNLLGGSVNIDMSHRFSKYTVKAQSSADDNFPGLVSRAAEGTAKDLGVSRNRPLLIIAEGNLDNALAKTRAQWEASQRLARSYSIEVVVQGWQQETGILWGLNQRMLIKSPTLGLDGEFLSDSIEHVRGYDEGTITKIGLTLKGAYKPAPQIPKGADDSLQSVVNFSKKNPRATE